MTSSANILKRITELRLQNLTSKTMSHFMIDWTVKSTAAFKSKSSMKITLNILVDN